MYKKLDSKPDLQSIQTEMLEFWEKERIFEKSVGKKNAGEKAFYDGPPFPTGKPHHGTVLVSFIKDMIARYQTMRGFSVPRVWGWDCHGLPIETQAEKSLGITDKKEIEASIGVEKFNDECFSIVSQNNDTWKEYVREMARWVDYDGAYKTMNPSYIESVIWAFKQCYDKGLIYQDFRVTPYCFRCETSLSVSDTRESDSTRPKQDTWALARFKSLKQTGGKDTYFLAWTTTPWTLPSNLALAVGAEYDYSYIEIDEKTVYVALKDSLARFGKVFGKEPKIIKTVKGNELAGERYSPLFDYFSNRAAQGCFRIIVADFVEKEEGIGIIHIAPAFGEDDYWACKKANIPMVNPVDEKGRFTDEVGDFAGRNVLEANMDVLRGLKAKGSIVDSGSLEHNYPHCWRCRTPLIYKAMQAWYFSVDKIKDLLTRTNQEVNWVPETVKNGRFGNWLSGARDWNISRNRYWSTPIPVWECAACKEKKALGSIEEIYRESGIRLTNLHKQYMDNVVLKCKCGGTMKRIPEVLDCWFESGCVSFAQKHYPFENKEWFDSHFPADFVVEYTGQIRCWFYYMHVLAGALFGKPAFKNCVVHGTVLAKDGKKLSKSSKNYTDPMELMKKYGTDAFRLYLFKSAAVLIGDLLFDENGLQSALQQIVMPLWNSAYFFTSYAILDGFYSKTIKKPKSDNALDKWILAKLYQTEKTITEAMDNYNIDKFIEPIESLLDGLTNWYIRRSRRRFWGSEMTADKKSAYETMHYVLVNICKLLAPAAPIISEKIFKHLTGKESLHLSDWADVPAEYKNAELLKETELVQEVIYFARSIRTKNNIKNRQPLSKMQVAFSLPGAAEVIGKARQIICEELNVKSIDILDDVEQIATIQYLPNFAVLAPKYGQAAGEIIRAVKGRQFTLKDGKIVLQLGGGEKTLDDGDVLVTYAVKTGQHIASGKGIVVSLDITITPELMREGIAREIVRNIQDMRKQTGCDISDRIIINFSGENPPAEWLEYIANETLCEYQNIGNPDAQCEIIGQEEPIVIQIKKKGVGVFPF